MKSIIQEASSVVKAIEKAWENAEKPTEFSVKIFEYPQKNFIGLTVKSAKIGIFFKESYVSKKDDRPKREPIKRKVTPTIQKQQPTKITPEPEKKTHIPPTEQKIQKREIWTSDLANAASKWVKGSLAAMGKSDIDFTTSSNNYYLRFVFNKPVAESDEKERELFRSFSFLMLQALKRQFKRPLRGFKIVLTR